MSEFKPYLYFGISWLVPGLGHILQKKLLKGLVFFGGILMLLVLGLIMGGGFTPLYNLQPLTLIGFLGGLGNGFFYFLIQGLGLGAGKIEAYTFNYGAAYMAVAGFFGYLIAFNAFVSAKGKTDV